MNYYERYCGDYSRDTAHLSLAEHGAYTLLLDAYYSTERALPASLDHLYRICRAMNKAEQGAVASVVEQFFPVSSDGLRHNRRADIDIPKALVRIASSKLNGSRGGRPPNPPETHQKPTGFRSGTPEANPSATQSGEASPDPMHHTPLKPNPLPRAAPAGFVEFWTAYPRKVGKGEAEKAWQRAKVPVGTVLAALSWQANSADWERDGGQFIPYPATYLNQRRWEDVPATSTAIPAGMVYE